MNTLELQRYILAEDLMPTEKLVGMALALHLSVSSMTIRIRQQTLAQECGLSARSIRRAINGLVAVGLFESRVTGRASILVPVESVSTVKNSGIVERPPVTYLIGHQCPTRTRKKRPSRYNPDTECSTRAEEIGKYDEKQFQAEMRRSAERHAQPSAPTDAP